MKRKIFFKGLDVDDIQYHGSIQDKKNTGEVIDFFNPNPMSHDFLFLNAPTSMVD